MEPDVVRLYSSSPPPLDEVGEEEDEDEFGDFGGYSGGMSSSFSEFDTPTAFGQLYAADTLPPDRHLKSLQAVSQAGKTPVVEETGKPAEKHQSSLGSNSKPSVYEPDVSVGRENGEPETSEVLVNGVSPYDLQGAHIALPNTARQGLYLSNRHSKLNRAPEEEEPRESRLNSTDTGPTGDHSTDTGPTGDHSTDAGPTGDHSTDAGPTGEHNTETKLAGDQSTQITLAVANGTEAVESRIDPQPPVSAGTFQREVPEPGDTAAGAQLAGVTSYLQPGTDSTAGPAAVPSSELPEEPEDEGRPAGPVADEDEDFGDFRAVDQGFADFSQTDSAMQEGFADFVTALSGCSSDEEFGDTDAVKDLREEEELAEEEEKEDEEEGPRCPELPQSDSFADFRSAPCSDLAGGAGESWAEFDLQGSCESQHESWAAFHEERQSSAATSPPSDSLQTNDVSGMLSCRLQHLFQSTFLSEVTPEVPEVATLRLLLEPQDHGDSLPVQGEPVALWHHLLDIHAAHGLKVQWVGSHSNRILLDSLGMRNILFTDSKHPVIVPIFAAGLGMLEPTKDPLKTSSAVRSSSSGQDTSTLCTPVVVSSRIGEDGGAVSQLNLDFFGPAEEDSDVDIDTDAPLPGVDPELYELTTAKLENSNTGSNRTDAFNKLMETIEKTSTLQRKPELDGEISEEAARVISVLPNLSFMKARVLMFPATLTPTANHL
ncbi:aftiphilin isoform X2 [Electrophorus electricus]|uniref:aftiphilin isoform X2 n=1 Tax=Electrophorus electricus TaxID=8005 RepID=UPI0015D0BA2B|nr:aftiphilin isoform X2 [Electrophorus electricus]